MSQHVMLSASITPDDLSKLRYPLLASPKYDGVRAFVDYQGDLRSRTGRRFNNSNLYALFGKLPPGLDGEIVIGNAPAETSGTLNSTGDVLSDISFWVFDYCVKSEASKNFEYRRRKLQRTLVDLFIERPQLRSFIELVDHTWVNDEHEALRFYQASTAALYPEGEGMVLRDPHGEYKFGRSTLRQQYSVKVKETDVEKAVVVRLEPLTRNGRVQAALGAVVCKTAAFVEEFNIGTGFTDEQRYELWRTLKSGDIVKFRYKPQGSIERPIQPVYVGVDNGLSDF